MTSRRSQAGHRQVTGENNRTSITPNGALYLSSVRGAGLEASCRNVTGPRTLTPRPRERFTDTVAEPQGPKDWNHPAPSEGKEGKKRQENEEVRRYSNVNVMKRKEINSLMIVVTDLITFIISLMYSTHQASVFFFFIILSNMQWSHTLLFSLQM